MHSFTLEELDIIEKIEFMIRYIDFYIEYCHNENLSVDGDSIAEILEMICDIEDSIDNTESFNEEDIKELYCNLNSLYNMLITLNDIALFNSIHVVCEYVLNDLKQKIEKRYEIFDIYKKNDSLE
ncbi:MAG: hypothetical protein IJJ47_08595 [Methanosphaera sp.]|nr:hypothetical protein [Methanosphaera sp.]